MTNKIEEIDATFNWFYDKSTEYGFSGQHAAKILEALEHYKRFQEAQKPETGEDNE